MHYNTSGHVCTRLRDQKRVRGAGQQGCSETLNCITERLRNLAINSAPQEPADAFISSLPAPARLRLYHNLHSSLKPFKQLSEPQLVYIFSRLHLAVPMLSALPLRTIALRSRVVASTQGNSLPVLNLSNSLQYTWPAGKHISSLQSLCFLCAYAPAFHGISPAPSILNLSHNSLTDAHADVIASILFTYSTSLQSLDLSGNPGLCLAAIEYFIAILPNLTAFVASVPQDETTPAALAPLIATASRAPALQALTLLFPLQSQHTAAPANQPDTEDSSSPGSAAEASKRHAPYTVEPSADLPSSQPTPHRFHSLHNLHLRNLPADSEEELLAAFPLGQLRLLDLGVDHGVHSNHAYASMPHAATPARQPLSHGTIRALVATPSRFRKLQALSLRGRCMPVPHACSAFTPAAAQQDPNSSDFGWQMSPLFQHLPKLCRVDAGGLPLFSSGPLSSSGRLPRDSAELPKRPHGRALCAVAADITCMPADFPLKLAQLTAVTALHLSGIPCGHSTRSVHVSSSAPPPQSLVWGRALQALTALQQLSLVHACMCAAGLDGSAASIAQALVNRLPALETLELAWKQPPARCDEDALPHSPVCDYAPSVAEGGRADGLGGAHSGGTVGNGFEPLAASLSGATALTSLTLRLPVHIPWSALRVPIGGLSALQQLTLQTLAEEGQDVGGAACMRGTPGTYRRSGGAAADGTLVDVGDPEGRARAAAVLDVAETMHGLRGLTALTRLRLSGVGALKCDDAERVSGHDDQACMQPQRLDGRAAGVNGAVPAAWGGGGPPHVAGVENAAGERRAAPAGCMADEQLAELISRAKKCRGAGGGGCPVCAREAARVRWAGTHACWDGLQELVLEAASSARLEAAAVCAVLRGMRQLQRLEVASGGSEWGDEEKLQVWAAVKGAPLLRGVRLL